MLAYAARYGNQPLSELNQMSMSALREFCDALARIVRAENGKGQPDDTGG